jgi:hypothetical protein
MGLLGQGFNFGGVGGTGATEFVASGSPAFWWAADKMTVQGDGTTITQMEDFSGNGNHLTQGTESKRATYETNEINTTLPIARFNKASLHHYGPTAFTLVQPVTIFFVVKKTDWNNNETLCDGNAPNSLLFRDRTTTPDLALYAGIYDPVTSARTIGAYHLLSARFDGASSFLRVDSGNQVTGNTGAKDPGGLAVNVVPTSTFHSNMDLAEIIVYNGAESVTANEAGLSTKYGL